MNTKKPWESKTLIVNLALALVPFIPGADMFLQAHPDAIVWGIVGVNFVLRIITHGKITIS